MSKGAFGGRLKALREAAGLTQQQLAERAGMHQFGVAKLEQGVREPSWATVQALAEALGLDCTAFTQDVPGEPEQPKRRPGRPRKPEDGQGEAAPQSEPDVKPEAGKGKGEKSPGKGKK